MSKVLVIGDYIRDIYHQCESTRLCPEAPVPILIERDAPIWTAGGAGLVCSQLCNLMDSKDITCIYNSESEKQRYFVGNHLVMRIDKDSYVISDPKKSLREIRDTLKSHKDLDAIIVSDYAKGSFNSEIAKFIIESAPCPVFVDSKLNWHWYDGAFAIFPNEAEGMSMQVDSRPPRWEHIIQKLGPEGCRVDNEIVGLKKSYQVKDSTGAGDIFLAGFVANYVLKSHDLISCAVFANKLAAASVEHIGTYVVRDIKP